MLLRFCLGWIAVLTMAATEAGAQETITQTERVGARYLFYEEAVWTVSYLPNINDSHQFDTTRAFDLLRRSGRYEIETKDTYCFAINHRLRSRAGESSYLGIAAFSLLKDNHNHPVSMFRNKKWKRANNPGFSRNNNSIKTSPLSPLNFFKRHFKAAATLRNTRLDTQEMYDARRTLDYELEYEWHGKYGEAAHEHSWDLLDLWDMSNNISLKLIEELGGSGWQNTRVDGKLIRFKFTEKVDPKKPPIFCLRGDNRVATVVRVFSPDLDTPWKFEFIFR